MPEREVADDNPAGRLVRFIRAIADVRGDGNTLYTRVAEVCGVPQDDQIAIFERVSLLCRLADDLEGAIRDSDLPEDYIDMLPELRHYLGRYQNMYRAGLDSMVTNPPAGLMTALKLCSAELSRRKTEQFPTADDLDEVRSLLNETIEFVRGSDVDPGLAAFLVSELHDLLKAVDEYHLAGKAPARAAYAKVFVEAQMTGGFPETEENRNAVQRFDDAVSRYPGLMHLATFGASLAPMVMAALQSGHHP